jgi:hypothetical protein
MTDYGIKIPVCYVNRDSGNVEGAEWKDMKHMLADADLLLNLGGVCWLPEFRFCRCRVLVDMDPLFTQVGRIGVDCPNGHHVHFSYGVNIGTHDCTIPTNGIDWHPTVPPVVPEIWQGSKFARNNCGQADAPFTTVANWSAYGSVIYRGEHYGQKNEEFLHLLELPDRIEQKLELALSGCNEETERLLRTAGWSVRDGAEISMNMPKYQTYISRSRGEFSVAKHAYVKTRSGWFSDRSVCYLAAGRPVILQDTGFSKWLPTGKGVLAFSSMDAADCIERVNADYPAHCSEAKQIAEQKFSYKVVLPQLLDSALVIRASKKK